jgi:methylenetetrahydrofolate reductase (NADPH)
MGKLADKLASGQTVFTAEIAPPKGAGIKRLLEHAALIGPKVDAINITDCQRALVRMSSLAACKVLLDAGYEPVLQLTCRDRNTIALQSDLMGAGALGIPNLLCLTGDPVKAGDCTQAKSVFEVESVRQLEIVAKLQSGTDWNGHKMNKKTKFLVGAVVNPSNQSLGGQFARMEKKVAAGAQFFQTQANYDLEDFRKFIEEAKSRFETKILAGVLLLHSAEVARYIHDNIPGIRIPDSVLAGFETTKDPERYGIDFAVQTMLALEGAADGFHLMTIRTEELLPKLWDAYHEKRNTRENSASSMPSAAGR